MKILLIIIFGLIFINSCGIDNHSKTCEIIFEANYLETKKLKVILHYQSIKESPDCKSFFLELSSNKVFLDSTTHPILLDNFEISSKKIELNDIIIPLPINSTDWDKFHTFTINSHLLDREYPPSKIYILFHL